MEHFNFESASGLFEKVTQNNTSLSEFVLQWETEKSLTSREAVLKRMTNNWKVMKESIDEGINKEGPTMGGLVKETAPRIKKALDSKIILRDRLSTAAKRAAAVAEVNASMGLIVAAPTAGSCGIIPSVLATAQDYYGFTDEEIVFSLLTAAGIGKMIAQKSSVSGADRGCQAECGSAAAMAAASVTELQGGSPEKVLNAAALSLKNSMGLVCDPVGGLVEVPCIKRNAFFAANAFVASDMALSGIVSFIPLDEVIGAMDEVGRVMSDKYKETAQGGLAVTPTALQYNKETKKS